MKTRFAIPGAARSAALSSLHGLGSSGAATEQRADERLGRREAPRADEEGAA